MIKGGNDTRVTHGVYAGSVMAIAWWAFSIVTSIEAPAEVVAASVTLVTGLVQYYMPTDA